MTYASPVFLLVQTLAIYATSWALWRVVRSLFIRSPFHELPGPPRDSLITGNLSHVYSPEGIPWHFNMSKKYGRVFRVHGLFGAEQLYVSDPRALHHIVVKDQSVYEETSMFTEGNRLIFGDGLLSTGGDDHKRQRKLLNPAFSAAHLRQLVPIFYPITYQLRDVLDGLLQDGPQEIDMLNWMSRTALEYIGQGGLGYSFDSFNQKSINPYSQAVKDLFPAVFQFAVVRQYLPYLVKIGTPSLRRHLLELIPSDALQRVKEIVDTMHNTSVNIFKRKKAALEAGEEVSSLEVGKGKDLMSLLLKANSVADERDRLPDNELLAQMNTLIFAAHDTTSSSLARMLHILALHPKEQERVRAEVIAARANVNGADFSYDELMALPYLDAVVRESLRLHAPFTFISRTARKEMILPFSTPIPVQDPSPNGRTHVTSVHVKPNTNIILGLGAANRDPQIWGEDADEWLPDRWLDQPPEEVAKERLPGIYSGIMTFMGGGRACIGAKFSIVEIKIVLTMLLEKYRFELPRDEIVWRNNSMATPTTSRRLHDTPHLPLKVSYI
ncbi:cytochrome P450-dit2 [Pleurotus ostreatus]|uniref:Cytochrome P450 n=3 Tax=Pleurotus TaxID=5320 RepID=A0A067NNC7_PLEO1|nr:cytochrome P450-dit2 [Pleurotus ostreatus]KAF7432814.1 cytochrome P450-dit2 [Pleurotus ostreatus]KAG9218766.1 hypothetical protein CCMSSC00406_0001120 [Pleurotus cornucopiae]KDQ29588.1 hypothetical protein PLEOSDRAFT_39510 [Pleurotus ostreatus PC15]